MILNFYVLAHKDGENWQFAKGSPKNISSMCLTNDITRAKVWRRASDAANSLNGGNWTYKLKVPLRVHEIEMIATEKSEKYFKFNFKVNEA